MKFVHLLTVVLGLLACGPFEIRVPESALLFLLNGTPPCAQPIAPGSGATNRPCPWLKLRAGLMVADLYPAAAATNSLGKLQRTAADGSTVYLQKLSSSGSRYQVLVSGATPLAGSLGWMERDKLEDATERCRR